MLTPDYFFNYPDNCMNNRHLTMNSWLLFSSPAFFALRNGSTAAGKGGWTRAFILLMLMVLFWGGAFWFFSAHPRYFLTIPDLGPVLKQKLLSMVFLTFFAILTVQQRYHWTFNLLSLTRSPPVHPSASSPWTIVRRQVCRNSSRFLVDDSLVQCPAFLAYGIVHGGGPMYYVMTLLTLIPFLMVPAAIGVIVTMALAYVLPAQRGKDLLMVFSALFLGLLYMFFRLLQPEKLVNPEAFSDFVAFLAAMQTPSSPLLPSTWASETLLPFLGLKTGDPFFYYLMLLSTSLSSWLLERGLQRRSIQSAGPKRKKGGEKADKANGRTRSFVDRPAVSLHHCGSVVKDLKTFCRDAGQWSQLFQLLALVVMYVYNFSVLPRGLFRGMLDLQNFVAFFNLALAAFVIAAIAIRFVFPALSLEGKTFWVMKSAPLHLRHWWWSKFWVALLPLLFFGELLAVVTNYFLGVSTFMMILAPVTLGFLTFALVALGMAFGIAYPNFTAEHVAKIPASFGGVLYMAFSIVFIGLLSFWKHGQCIYS